MEDTYLKNQLPELSLRCFAHHFIDRLSVPELQCLKEIAAGLHEQCIPIGSTCSGLATAGICFQAVLDAINERFNTKIAMRCKFAVENHPGKKEFIKAAHGDKVEHIFENVTCFGQNAAFCEKEKEEVQIPEVFLLVTSPSCTNLSGQRGPDRQGFAACYEKDCDGESESRETYLYGYREAMKKTKAQVSIFENVKDASHHLKDEQGVPQKPAVEVIKQDFAEMNHSFAWMKLDSSQFLVPQRRVRVWGSSCPGDCPDYETRMKMTWLRLRSSSRIPLSAILTDGLESETPPGGETAQKHIKEIKRMCKERNLNWEEACFDIATSRVRLPEWAYQVLTCVRPSHKIWHLGLGRFIRSDEMLRSHGVFASDFAHPSAILELDPTLCDDLAGNAFSTPVLIATMLATMVNNPAWRALAKTASGVRGMLNACKAKQQVGGKRQGCKERSDSKDEPAQGSRDEPAQGPPCKKQKQQTQSTLKFKRKCKNPGNPPEDGGEEAMAGQKPKKQKTSHKGSCITIAKKMAILKELDELKKTHKTPEKDFFGCFILD